MNRLHHHHGAWVKIAIPAALGFAGLVSVGAHVYAHLRIETLTRETAQLKAVLASTTEAFGQNIAALDQRTAHLGNSLANAEQEIRATRSNVDDVRSQVGGVAATVGTISGTVTNLEKLTKTDPELLQKYSKVFFLNEHYAPERVADIAKKYLYSENNPEVVHAAVLPYLQSMLGAAETVGMKLYVKSAYRSFDEQTRLKGAYTVTYGAGTAHTFSADQGYSEHQLGTTVDFMTSGIGGDLERFEGTEAHKWLQANAHRYGFTLSYPPNNKYYVYEPWHWRFVGVKLATYLKENNKYFYDLEQREIDEYLIHLFE